MKKLINMKVATFVAITAVTAHGTIASAGSLVETAPSDTKALERQNVALRKQVALLDQRAQNRQGRIEALRMQARYLQANLDQCEAGA